MKRSLLLVVIAILIAPPVYSTVRLATPDDFQNGTIQVEGMVTQDKGMDVVITNYDSGDTIELDPTTLGMDPTKASDQVIGFSNAEEIAMGAYYLSLRPFETKRAKLKWRCLQAHKGTPNEGARYHGLPVHLPPYIMMGLRSGMDQNQLWKLIEDIDGNWLENAKGDNGQGSFVLETKVPQGIRIPQFALAYQTTGGSLKPQWLAIDIEVGRTYLLPAGRYYLWVKPHKSLKPIVIHPNRRNSAVVSLNR